MPDSDDRRRVVDLARRVLRPSRPGSRRPADDGESPAPALSVVVPVYNVAPYLAECLDSLLGQSLTDLEVIAVDDGSTDSCPEILAEWADRDPRLRVITQRNAGQGPARNVGVAAARGQFLTFCDSDDVVPRRAYEAMVRTLRRSGSDFVVGAARRVKHGTSRNVAWGATVHEFDRIATTIEQFPAAMQDIIACNRVFRTEFWRDRVGGFEGGIAYEDHVPMLAAYVRAGRFDVLARVTYHWRIREDHTSTGQQKADLGNLRDRVAVKEQAHALLLAEASAATYDAWVGRCLDIDFPPFLVRALTGSEDYRALLASTYRTFLDRSTPAALATVRHDRLVRAWLCAGGHWAELAEVDEAFRTAPPGEVRLDRDRLVAVPRLPERLTSLVPAEAWQLADSETALRSGLASVVLDQTVLRVAGYAAVPGLDTGIAPLETTAWLARGDGTPVVELTVEAAPDQEVDRWVDDGTTSHRHSGFVATVDLATLDVADGDLLRLRLRVGRGALTREGGVYTAVEGSGAGSPPRAAATIAGRRVRVDTLWDQSSGFAIVLGGVDPRVSELVAPTDDVLRGRVTGLPASGRVLARQGEHVVATTPEADGSFTLDLRSAGSPAPAGRPWSLRAQLPGRPAQPLLWPGGPEQVGERGSAAPVWRRAPDGSVHAAYGSRELVVEEIGLEPAVGPDGTEDLTLTARVRTIGLDADEVTELAWRSRHAALPARIERLGDGRLSLAAPLARTDLPGLLAPAAAYLLVGRTADGDRLEARAGDTLAARTPSSQTGSTHRVRVRLRGERTVVVDLGAPLDDEESSPAFQSRRQQDHRRRATPAPAEPRPVLLHADRPGWQSRRGLTAALLARGEARRVSWSVGDRSTPLPDGVGSVLVGARSWYDAVDAATLVASGELPDFVVPGVGQRTIQTFAGFPVLPVGLSAWRARGLPGRTVALELERRRRQWGAIAAPTEEIAELYRREFEFDGPVVVTGHPRTDALVGRNLEAVRAEVRSSLGAPDEERLVLVAKSEHSRATRALLRATAAEDLDLLRLADGLGPGHTVLVMGVAHVPEPAPGGARLLDATHHPSVADLLVASDAAVLDYSDLRFDWALTGRPALFHVPDLEAYLDAVPAPLDFEETAVGPRLTTTDDVVEALRAPDAGVASYAGRLGDVRRRFHTHHDGAAAARVIRALLD